MKNRVRLRDLVYRHRLEVRMRLHAELRDRIEPLDALEPSAPPPVPASDRPPEEPPR